MNIDLDINAVPFQELKDYKLIDIREANELVNYPSVCECPHVPLSGFPENLNKFSKDDKYLLFCAMGGRSHHLAEILNAEGFTTYSVNGGVSAVNAYFNVNA